MTTNIRDLPVAVVGAGPVGLAVAAHLIERGVPVRVYEAGPTVATSVRQWGHVRLFSPWRYNTDRAARALLMRHGWQEPPADAFPTGGDLYHAYLKPLAETPEMAAIIETRTAVKAITRHGLDKVSGNGSCSARGCGGSERRRRTPARPRARRHRRVRHLDHAEPARRRRIAGRG